MDYRSYRSRHPGPALAKERSGPAFRVGVEWRGERRVERLHPDAGGKSSADLWRKG